MKLVIVLSTLIALAAASAYWYVSTTGQPVDADSANTFTTGNEIPDGTQAGSDSPFAVGQSDSRAATAAEQLELALNTPPRPPSLTQLPSSQPLVWDSSLNDEQLRSLANDLQANEASLQQFIDDFRQETDPALKKLRANVLGDVGGEQATLVASELIFSGDSASRTLGMGLLQQIQPGNAAARDIVSGMLATEVDPPVLVEALNALASPGQVDTQSRAYLSDQVAWLTTHQDDRVRSISLDILSRWSNDGQHTDALLAGLDDASEYVRAAAAYALVSHEEKTPVVIERLLRTLNNEQEPKAVKNAAILALRAMPLSTAQAAEIDQLERQLNIVQ